LDTDKFRLKVILKSFVAKKDDFMVSYVDFNIMDDESFTFIFPQKN